MPKSKRVQSKKQHSQRALNAFDLAESDDERLSRRGGPVTLSEDSEDEKDYTTGEVAEEDDEEIDSDEALGSDDDEEYFSRLKKDGKKRKTKDSDSEEEEGYESIDESELVPLSQVWDIDDGDKGVESDDGDENIKLDHKYEHVSSEDSGDSEEESVVEDDDSEEDSLFSDEEFDDVDDVDESKLSNLRKMIAELSNTTDLESSREIKKQRLQVNNITESEFSLPTGSRKVTLAELTESFHDPSDSKSLKLLKDSKGNTVQLKSLAVPLPKRIQQRHDRKAAYEIAKEEVGKWEETVKTNRESEHLHFPINPSVPLQKSASFAPLAPSTDMEKKINTILLDSSLADEKALSTFEELATSKLSMEELKKRRNELRLMRELMFREEQKAKRIKKIKSKAYRKVHKKERERQRQMVEGDEEDPEEHDVNRAQERMTLKHKNTGKWAREMIDRGFTKDQETRAEMEEMLRRNESLKRKIQDIDSEDQESDDEAFLNENPSTTTETEAHNQKVGKGLMAMKFMRDAEARERKQNELALEELRNSKLENGFEELADGDSSANKPNEVVNEGRRKFAPGSSQSQTEMLDILQDALEEQEIDQEKSMSATIERGFAKIGSNETNWKQGKIEQPLSDQEDNANPWLLLGDSNKPLQKSKSVLNVDKNSSMTDKAQNKIRKERAKSKNEKKEDEDVAIDSNQTLKIIDPYGSENSDNDTEGLIKIKGKKVSFKQADMVKRAFAGDDVVEEFQQEKRQRIEEDGDKEIDVTLPGWGTWGGSGVKKSTKKKFIKKISGIKAEKRQDAKLKNVIISEKVNKKVAKYTAGNVPFPYENREQYERSLRMPIGQEWASRDTHQRLTMPRVTVKQGTIIDPIKAPFK